MKLAILLFTFLLGAAGKEKLPKAEPNQYMCDGYIVFHPCPKGQKKTKRKYYRPNDQPWWPGYGNHSRRGRK